MESLGKLCDRMMSHYENGPIRARATESSIESERKVSKLLRRYPRDYKKTYLKNSGYILDFLKKETCRATWEILKRWAIWKFSCVLKEQTCCNTTINERVGNFGFKIRVFHGNGCFNF